MKVTYQSRIAAGSALVAFLGVLVALAADPNAAHAQRGCFWDGTAPVCRGKCPPNFYVRSRDSCLSGSKVLCCPNAQSEPVRECRWFGTAPICRGSCPRGYVNRGVAQANCLNGFKVYCCRKTG